MTVYKDYNDYLDKNPQIEAEIDGAYDYVYAIHKMTNDLNNSMTDIDNDYQYGDEWDWDRNDRSQYCEHGTFIGSWWGPDLLCGKCEMGDEPMNIDDEDDF